MHRRHIALIAGAAAIAALLGSAEAFACAVCAPNGDSEASVQAFRLSTAIMSLLPLALIGVTVYWVWRRFRAHEQASDELSRHSEGAAMVEVPTGATRD